LIDPACNEVMPEISFKKAVVLRDFVSVKASVGSATGKRVLQAQDRQGSLSPEIK
jgi:hypothetical protein